MHLLNKQEFTRESQIEHYIIKSHPKVKVNFGRSYTLIIDNFWVALYLNLSEDIA